MSKKGKKNKTRVPFRPNLEKPARTSSSLWTKDHKEGRLEHQDPIASEAVKGKGRLSRHKTVDVARAGALVDLKHIARQQSSAPKNKWQEAVVVSIHGQFARVRDNQMVRTCVQRQVLKSLLLDQHGAIAVGDVVKFTPIGQDEGVIEQVGPRHGMLVRKYRHKERLIATNIDQVLIVCSVAQPDLKIHLLDRYIIAALTGQLEPVVVFNKVDLPHDQPLKDYAKVYSKLGYRTFLVSAETGSGIKRLSRVLVDKKTVLAGQSGVGKSTLLNRIQPDLALTVKPVNRATGRGRHTTTAVKLLKLDLGGYVVDTPGIRQFAFWQINQQDLAGCFSDLAQFQGQCRFPNCSHTHEDHCTVKQAVSAGQIAPWRYSSYVRIYNDPDQFAPHWQR